MPCKLVTGGDDRRILNHQDDRPFGCPGTMNNPARNHKPLPWSKLYNSPGQAVVIRLKIDHEKALEYKEKLIIGIVLVPVVFPLHHPEPHDGIIHSAEGLVIPLILDRPDQRTEFNLCERWEENVQVRRVRER